MSLFVDLFSFLGYNYIMFKWKKAKESNVAYTPETSKRSPLKKLNSIFFLLTFFSIVLYSCYTFFIIYQLAEKTFLSKAIMYLLIAYICVFILLVLLNLRNKRRMKSKLRDYKSATKFLKYIVQIINFALSISTAISAFITTGTTDISALAYAVLSIIITIVFILFEIVVIKIRRSLPLIKKNFLELREKPSKNRSQ